MISVNGFKLPKENFLSGECRLSIPRNIIYESSSTCLFTDDFNFDIVWLYENDSELFSLRCIVKHIKNVHKDAFISLHLPYIPHARMDRVEDDSTIFTLKWFCEEINSLEFNQVTVRDPHSNVSVALLDKISVEDIKGYLRLALCDAHGRCENFYQNTNEFGEPKGAFNGIFPIVLYFPDEGAYKRYKKLSDSIGSMSLSDEKTEFIKIYGSKVRDWKTGKIQSLELSFENGSPWNAETLKMLATEYNYGVMMVDDIVSYGGTMFYSALKLKELGFKDIFAYATHVENSVLDREHGTLIKLLDDGTVKRLYTTKSIFNKEHESIKIIEHD